MVGVGAALADDGDGLVHGDALQLHEADELGDDHGGMGVVDLDYRVLVQVPGGVALLGQLLQDELGGVADHEILLVHPQQAAGPVAVVGVQKQGEVMGDVLFVEVDALFHQALVHGLQIEQPQAVDLAAVAGDVHLVQPGAHLPLGEGARRRCCRSFSPRGRRERATRPAPPAAYSPRTSGGTGRNGTAGPPRRRAGPGWRWSPCSRRPGGPGPRCPGEGSASSSSRAAREAAGLGQGLLHRGVEPQVDQVVGEELAHQKLGGDVVELLISLDAGASSSRWATSSSRGVVQFLVRGGGQVPCPPLPQLLFQFFPNIHCHPSFLARPVMTVSRAIFFASFLVAMPFCMRQLQLWLPTVEGMFMRASLPRVQIVLEGGRWPGPPRLVRGRPGKAPGDVLPVFQPQVVQGQLLLGRRSGGEPPPGGVVVVGAGVGDAVGDHVVRQVGRSPPRG